METVFDRNVTSSSQTSKGDRRNANEYWANDNCTQSSSVQNF